MKVYVIPSERMRRIILHIKEEEDKEALKSATERAPSDKQTNQNLNSEKEQKEKCQK
jgi:hypothetical protein